MKLAKIVKDVFGEIMEEAGYTYVKAHAIVWSYEKKMGDSPNWKPSEKK